MDGELIDVMTVTVERWKQENEVMLIRTTAQRGGLSMGYMTRVSKGELKGVVSKSAVITSKMVESYYHLLLELTRESKHGTTDQCEG